MLKMKKKNSIFINVKDFNYALLLSLCWCKLTMIILI